MASAPELLGRVEDLGDVEVALARRRRPDGIRLVGGAHVEGGAIGVGVDGDGGDAELAAGAHHAHGDLAAVGDQDLAGSGVACPARNT